MTIHVYLLINPEVEEIFEVLFVDGMLVGWNNGRVHDVVNGMTEEGMTQAWLELDYAFELKVSYEESLPDFD